MPVPTRTVVLLSSCICVGLPAEETNRPQSSSEVRTHDVSTLVAPVSTFSQVIRPQGDLVYGKGGKRQKQESPKGGKKQKQESPGLEFEPAPPQVGYEENANELIQLLNVHLTKKGLIQEALPGLQIVDGLLTVPGGPEIQNEAEDFIVDLREKTGARYLVEVVLISPDALGEIIPGWRGLIPHPPGDIVERVLLDPRSCLLSCAVPCGRWTLAGTRTGRPSVADYDVSQTGVIPVAAPSVENPLGGDWMEVRVTPVPGAGEVWVDLCLGRFRLGGVQAKIGAEFGDLDLSTTKERLFFLSTVVAESAWILPGSIPGEDGVAAFVRVVKEQHVRSPMPRQDGVGMSHGVYDFSLLFLRNEQDRWWSTDRFGEGQVHDGPAGQGRAADGKGEDAQAGGKQLGDLSAELEALIPAEDLSRTDWGLEAARGGRWFHLWAPRHVHEKFVSLVGARIQEASQLCTVDLEILDLERKDLVLLRSSLEKGRLLKEEWEKTLGSTAQSKRSAFSLTGVTGMTHALRGDTMHTLVTGVTNVSGGTGFAIVEVVDPEIEKCGEGTEVYIRVDILEAGAAARLTVRGTVSQMDESQSVVVRFPRIRMAQDQLPTKGHEEITLSLPRQTAHEFALDSAIPFDRYVLIQGNSDEGKQAKVIVARVRRWK